MRIVCWKNGINIEHILSEKIGSLIAHRGFTLLPGAEKIRIALL